MKRNTAFKASRISVVKNLRVVSSELSRNFNFWRPGKMRHRIRSKPLKTQGLCPKLAFQSLTMSTINIITEFIFVAVNIIDILLLKTKCLLDFDVFIFLRNLCSLHYHFYLTTQKSKPSFNTFVWIEQINAQTEVFEEFLCLLYLSNLYLVLY